VKIDTDGFDLAVIRGGLAWIDARKPVLFFEYSVADLAAMATTVSPP
jgi:hypothetical protein